MTEPKKISSEYHVYDHVLNITKVFKNKSKAYEYCDKLNNPPVEEIESTEPNSETNQTN